MDCKVPHSMDIAVDETDVRSALVATSAECLALERKLQELRKANARLEEELQSLEDSCWARAMPHDL